MKVIYDIMVSLALDRQNLVHVKTLGGLEGVLQVQLIALFILLSVTVFAASLCALLWLIEFWI